PKLLFKVRNSLGRRNQIRLREVFDLPTLRGPDTLKLVFGIHQNIATVLGYSHCIDVALAVCFITLQTVNPEVSTVVRITLRSSQYADEKLTYIVTPS